jgi:hypothetical protein
MLKFAFKNVSTKKSEPTYWTILSVMLKIYFTYKVAGKKWPHDSYMTGRAGVWEAEDIDKFYIALLDFFPATL